MIGVSGRCEHYRARTASTGWGRATVPAWRTARGPAGGRRPGRRERPSGAAGARAYWDAAQVAPLHPAGREALLAALDDGWADPERLHREGRTARMLLDGAREAVAAALGARTEEVSFTGSHTAAVHAAVLGTLAARRPPVQRLVHSAVEHSSVLACARWHLDRGGEVVAVPVDRLGRVDPAVVVRDRRTAGDGAWSCCCKYLSNKKHK